MSMFGICMPNQKLLSAQDKAIYQSYYCGLCHTLGSRHGGITRLTLNYEMTFLALLFSALDENESPLSPKGCLLHPVKARAYPKNRYLEYAADADLLLIPEKLDDDWKDEKKLTAKLGVSLLKAAHEKAAAEHPVLAKTISEDLAALYEAERHNELNPDIPAGLFGKLTASLFTDPAFFPESEKGLGSFGFLLGKAIYLLDADVDLRSDLKHQRYNPFVMYDEAARAEVLNCIMGDVTEAYRALPLRRYQPLLENILFSGIWTKHDFKQNRTNRKGEMV